MNRHFRTQAATQKRVQAENDERNLTAMRDRFGTVDPWGTLNQEGMNQGTRSATSGMMQHLMQRLQDPQAYNRRQPNLLFGRRQGFGGGGVGGGGGGSGRSDERLYEPSMQVSVPSNLQGGAPRATFFPRGSVFNDSNPFI